MKAGLSCTGTAAGGPRCLAAPILCARRIRALAVTMVSADDGWALGGTSSTPATTILHWDGFAWNFASNPTTSRLTSVGMVSATDGWAVGFSGTILRYVGVHRLFLPVVLAGQ